MNDRLNERRKEKSLGVIFHPQFSSRSLADYARRAEKYGFDELWLWDDCFLPGAFTAAGIALQATESLKVGIGLLPATAYNPLFAAMEITTLAQAFPGRFMPGFGHGLSRWMEQIGAKPKSSLKALEETVTAVRRLLEGERVIMQGEQVKLDFVQMQSIPAVLPPIYVGAIREKTLELAGRLADGTILPEMSSPGYVRWAAGHIRRGMELGRRSGHRVLVYLDVKTNRDGESARAATRRALAEKYPWNQAQVEALGIKEEVEGFVQRFGIDRLATDMPEAWLDGFAAAGKPEQTAEGIGRLFEAGAEAVIFCPLNGDPFCLDEYGRHLMPLLKARR